jgi:hypothetical protein
MSQISLSVRLIIFGSYIIFHSQEAPLFNQSFLRAGYQVVDSILPLKTPPQTVSYKSSWCISDNDGFFFLFFAF